MLLILLTTLMGFIAILSSWSAITERVKEFYIFMLVLQTGMIGVRVARLPAVLPLLGSDAEVPICFLIGIWGGGRRLYSAIKFFLYTLVGSVVMLLGILALYFQYATTGVYVRRDALPADERADRDAAMGVSRSSWVSRSRSRCSVPYLAAGCAYGRADRRVGHPDAVLLKMGTYGFIRFSLPILPDATHYFVPMVAGLSIIGIVYGALVALAQSDWKRLVAVLERQPHGPGDARDVLAEPGRHGGVDRSADQPHVSTGALFLIVGNVSAAARARSPNTAGSRR